jgi:hypothetical protein
MTKIKQSESRTQEMSIKTQEPLLLLLRLNFTEANEKIY